MGEAKRRELAAKSQALEAMVVENQPALSMRTWVAISLHPVLQGNEDHPKSLEKLRFA